jgi:hypothetical protein
MHQVVRDRIAIKIGLDFGLKVRVVAQCVEHLSKEGAPEFLPASLRVATALQLHAQESASSNDWFSAENALISCNITVTSYDYLFSPSQRTDNQLLTFSEIGFI